MLCLQCYPINHNLIQKLLLLNKIPDMKSVFFISLFLLFRSGIVWSATSYDFAAQIPDSLTKNADAVIRFYNTSYQIISPEKLKGQVHFAVTVLNKSGERFASLVENYDKSKRVSIQKVVGYNSMGKVDKNIDRKLIQDISYHGSYSFFSDNRVKYMNVSGSHFPYTLEYAYEVELNGMIHIDTWLPVEGTGISVQEASLQITSSSKDAYKFKALNFPFAFSEKNDDDKYVQTWEVQNIKAYKPVEFSPAYVDRLHVVIAAPVNFKYEGCAGSMDSWKTYGLWVNDLLADRDLLPENVVAEIKQLTDSCVTDYGKAKVIYEYMQARTRYVSIQLGIGGFQPMTAQEVHTVGYGDCKALSNYTKALLKVVGIEAFYTEIGAGSSQKIRFPDFVSATQTNHAILTLPLKNDTVFMECTSQSSPFGYVGTFTANRYALMITPEGGKLVHTPVYSPENNMRSRSIRVDLGQSGSVHCSFTNEYHCGQYDRNIAYFNTLSGDEQRKFLLKDNRLSGTKLGKFDVVEHKSRYPSGLLFMDLTAEKYASVMGSRMIFTLNPNVDEVVELSDRDARVVDIVKEMGFLDIDSVHIKFPNEYLPEFLPQPCEHNCTFGSFSCSVQKISDNELLYVRKLRVEEGHFDKALYPELVSFYKLVAGKDNEKVVLKKM